MRNTLTFFFQHLVIILLTTSSCEKNEVSKISIPVIETYGITLTTRTTAHSYGKVISTGGTTFTEVGMCWSTTPSPTVDDNIQKYNSVDLSVLNYSLGDSLIYIFISDLEPNTTYFIRAYGITLAGIGYGKETSFTTCGDGEGVTDIDGNFYPTVIIGNQEWMAINLKTTKYRDGSPIPNVINANQWINLSTGAYCWYKNDESNKENYGGYYNWYAVETGNLCPTGWHVPSNDDWLTLISFAGVHVADELKSEVWGYDSYHFNAIPASGRWNGYFDDIDFNWGIGYWWSSTEKDVNEAGALMLHWDMRFEQDFNFPWYYGKNNGLSVRCIKNIQ